MTQLPTLQGVQEVKVYMRNLSGAGGRGTLQSVQEVKSIGVTWQERGEGVNALPIFYLPKNFFYAELKGVKYFLNQYRYGGC